MKLSTGRFGVWPMEERSDKKMVGSGVGRKEQLIKETKKHGVNQEQNRGKENRMGWIKNTK